MLDSTHLFLFEKKKSISWISINENGKANQHFYGISSRLVKSDIDILLDLTVGSDRIPTLRIRPPDSYRIYSPGCELARMRVCECLLFVSTYPPLHPTPTHHLPTRTPIF